MTTKTINGTDAADTITFTATNTTVNAGEGANTITGTSGDNEINSGDGVDTITVTSGNNKINAGGGANTIVATFGINEINTGDGVDTITTGGLSGGGNTIDAGDGANTITTGAGSDTITSGDGADTITTGAGDDVVHGGNGANTITTGAGNDTVYSGVDADTITTGEGDDTIHITGGTDTIAAGTDNDTLIADFSLATGAVSINTLAGTAAAGYAGNISALGIVTFAGVENFEITSGGFNDIITTGDGADVVHAGAGSDIVNLAGGNDQAIYTMAANDGASDVYQGGAGVDTLMLNFTQDQWGSDEVRADIAKYLAFQEAHTSPSGEADSAVFQFTVFDLSVSEFEALNVIVDGVALDPTDAAVDDVADLNEDADATHFASVLDNDDAGALVDSVSLISGPSEGILAFNTGPLGSPDGSYSFDPNGDFEDLAAGETRDVSFVYEVQDAYRGPSQATVTITVTGTNDAPTVADAVANTTNEDAAAYSVDLLDGASDVDTTDVLNVANLTVVSGDVSGITLSGNVLSVNPSAYTALAVGTSEIVTYSYDIVDGNGGSVAQSATITITGTNDAPTLTVSDLAATEDGGPVISATPTFTDIDVGDAPAYSVGGVTGGGSVSVNAGTGVYTYDPGTNFQSLANDDTATVNFNVTVDDGNGGTDTETVTVTITGTNDAPILAVTDLAATEDGASVSGTPTSTDADTDDTHSYTVAAMAAGQGSVAIVAGTGEYTYSPGSDFQSLATGETTTVSFDVTLADNNGGSDTENVTITITGTNDAPVAVSETNVAVLANVLTNGSFEDGNPVSPGGITFPASLPGWTSEQRTFEVWGNGFLQNYASDGIAFLELDNGSGRDAYSSTLNTQVGQTYTLEFDLAQRNGTPATDNQVEFFVNGTSLGIFTPTTTTFRTFSATFIGSGTDVIKFQEPASANNGLGGLIDNLRVVGNDQIATGNVLANDTDADNGAILTVGAIDGVTANVGTAVVGAYGSVTIATNGDYTYVQNNLVAATAALAEGEPKDDAFTYTATDEHGATAVNTVTLTVTGTNDAPVITSDAVAASGSVTEAGHGQVGVAYATGMLKSSDVDNTSSATWSSENTTGTYGSFAINPTTGEWSYTLDNNNTATEALAEDQVDTEVFTVTVTDDFGAIDTQDVTVTVVGANDSPPQQLIWGRYAGAYPGNTAIANGGDGVDIISFEDFAGISHGSAIANGGDGNDEITFGPYAGHNYGSATANGGDGVDIISFEGYAGIGINGSATANGGAGNDEITFGGYAGYYYGSATADGGDGVDIISFEDFAGYYYGSATVDGGAGNDEITFGRYAGYYYGSATVDGGAGNDEITFGDRAGYINGSVIANGGAGADTFEFGTRAENLTIDLGAGDEDRDSVTFKGSVKKTTIDNWEYGVDANIDVVDPTAWTAQIENGNTVLTTNDNQSLTFIGITDANLNVSDFLI